MAFSPSDLTISVWINPNSTQLDFAGIIDKSHTASYVSDWVLQGTNHDKPRFYFAYCTAVDVNTNVQCSSFLGDELNAATTANQWNHLVFIKQGNTISSYQNGKIISTMTSDFSDYRKTNKPLFIGAVNSMNRYFNGLIDDTSIYNRALTEAEVLELYKGELAKPQTADLNMSISAPSSVSRNQKNTYTFTINNSSKITAKGVKANFVVPRKAFATVEIPQNCTLNGRVLECKLADLSAGQSATQTLSMSMLKKGALSVVGLVNFNADDANYDDNKVSAVVSVK